MQKYSHHPLNLTRPYFRLTSSFCFIFFFRDKFFYFFLISSSHFNYLLTLFVKFNISHEIPPTFKANLNLISLIHEIPPTFKANLKYILASAKLVIINQENCYGDFRKVKSTDGMSLDHLKGNKD